MRACEHCPAPSVDRMGYAQLGLAADGEPGHWTEAIAAAQASLEAFQRIGHAALPLARFWLAAAQMDSAEAAFRSGTCRLPAGFELAGRTRPPPSTRSRLRNTGWPGLHKLGVTASPAVRRVRALRLFPRSVTPKPQKWPSG